MTKSDKNAAFYVVTFEFQVHSGPILGQGAQEYWDTQIWDQLLWASRQPLTSYLSSWDGCTYWTWLTGLWNILFVSMYIIWSVITFKFSNLHAFSTMLVNGFWVVLLYFCRFRWYGWWYSHCTSEGSYVFWRPGINNDTLNQRWRLSNLVTLLGLSLTCLHKMRATSL